jgi:7,8-dihydroneopterin aldolase/epimerase/oxygenase
MARATNNSRKTSCVRLMNAVFYAHHGVRQVEHEVGARYEVDAELYLDITEAGETDELSKTVDYAVVYTKIREAVTAKKFFLIEAVAKKISDELLADFPNITSISVRVRKKNPPVGGVCDYAEAEYVVDRNSN